MDEPRVVWCGGVDADQDVCIRLVRSGIRGGINQEHTHPCSRQTLAVVKVNSSHLRNCSKYFATALSDRWGKLNRNRASLEFVLEVHGEVATYINCFSRMYTPFLKQFQDVKHSLNILQVATQIEFHDLMSSICRYLSSIMWSEEDEKTIRLCVGSSLFPRSHAKNLVAPLMMAGKEDRRKQIFNLIKRWILPLYDEEENSSAGGFLKGLLKAIREEEQRLSSTFENEVVAFINKGVERMLYGLDEEYGNAEGIIYDVPDFVPKLRAIHRVLEALLVAEMGEGGVKFFLSLDSYPELLRDASEKILDRDIQGAATKFAGLIIVMFEQVVMGNVVLGIPNRIVLLKSWHSLFENLEERVGNDRMLENYKGAAEALFCTLPFKQQMELLNNDLPNSQSYITPSSLAKLWSSHWSAELEEVMQGGWIE